MPDVPDTVAVGRARARAEFGARLLVVEDDRQLSELLVELFTSENYRVDVALDGHTGLHLALSREYDALVIDRMLPAIEGLDLVTRIRRHGITRPILILTALATLTDRVAGLDAGAEDYLVKPFEIDELLARVRALHRRHLDHARLLPLGGGHLDLEVRAAVLTDGRRETLTTREFELLRHLAGRPKAVHTRDELRTLLFPETSADSIVDTYVYYLRRKLGRGVVRTIRGLGYQAGVL